MSIQGVLDELRAIDAQLSKVQKEIPQVGAAFLIRSLDGIFKDDIGIAVGDLAYLRVTAGRVGQFNDNGMLNNITPGTQVSYKVLHAGVWTNEAVEAFP